MSNQIKSRKLHTAILLGALIAAPAYAAPPTFGNPSPTGGTSQKANEMADKTL